MEKIIANNVSFYDFRIVSHNLFPMLMINGTFSENVHDSLSVLHDALLTKKNIKYNRWQHRNGPFIHDVTSVK